MGEALLVDFGDVEAERGVLESTYEDLLEIWRPVDVKEGGVTQSVLSEVARDVPCALSQVGWSYTSRSEQTESFNRMEGGEMVFVPPEADVRPGDTLVVLRLARVLEREAAARLVYEPVGRPIVYRTHKQVTVKVRENV